MHDRPTTVELLAAVRGYLQQEILPTLGDHRLKFRTLIAANVLAVVERELEGEEAQLREEWHRLMELVSGSSAERPDDLPALRTAVEEVERVLCARIRAGEADVGLWGQAVRAFARWSVEEKLRVSNPRYLAALSAEAGAIR
jgi:hypothetical protein